MKTALVFPRTKYPTGDPPLGVAYLASMVKECTGAPPVIIDTTFSPDPYAQIKKTLSEEKFDLVGISAMVTMSEQASETAKMAKSANPDSMVIMGGPHPTTLPELALKTKELDAVCIGEGEHTIKDIIKKGSIENVPGLLYRSGKGITGDTREPVTNLDTLAFPALDLLPMDDYFKHWFQLDGVENGLKGTTVLATRGCPFKCAYCQPTLDMLFGKKLRKRSPENVINELELRKKEFGITGFIFADDTFIADRKWVKDFCGELTNRETGLKWGCNIRADIVDEELLSAMYEAGLRKTYIGIEVFDDVCRREVFNKNLKRTDVESAVMAAKKLNIRTQGYFMLGAPGEQRKDVWNTVRYAFRLPVDDATFNITTPLPATYLFENNKDKISSRPDEMDYYKRYAFKPENKITQSWLNKMQKVAYLGFYLRPNRLINQIKSFLSPGGASRFLSKLRRVF
jgi:radical SAM superfamily enzyme YgiQ (UPF0313 family)